MSFTLRTLTFTKGRWWWKFRLAFTPGWMRFIEQDSKQNFYFTTYMKVKRGASRKRTATPTRPADVSWPPENRHELIQMISKQQIISWQINQSITRSNPYVVEDWTPTDSKTFLLSSQQRIVLVYSMETISQLIRFYPKYLSLLQQNFLGVTIIQHGCCDSQSYLCHSLPLHNTHLKAAEQRAFLPWLIHQVATLRIACLLSLGFIRLEDVMPYFQPSWQFGT